jgi:hypothetical protein
MPEDIEKKKSRYVKAWACLHAFTYARDIELPELAALYAKLPRKLQEELDNAFPEE